MSAARGMRWRRVEGSAGRSGGVGGRRRAWLGSRRERVRCDGAPRVVLWRPCVLVAQLDRASDSGSEGRGFESLRAHTDPRGRGGGRPDAGGPRCASGRTRRVSSSARCGRMGGGEDERGRTHGCRGSGIGGARAHPNNPATGPRTRSTRSAPASAAVPERAERTFLPHQGTFFPSVTESDRPERRTLPTGEARRQAATGTPGPRDGSTTPSIPARA